MRRFYVPPENFSADRVVLSGEDVHHIRSVLRLRAGDPICVFDGQGRRYQVQLTEVSRKEVAGVVVNQEPARLESPVAIHLGLALLKGGRFEEVMRQAVQLGVKTIHPLQTERTVVRMAPRQVASRVGRWQRIAGEAAKQCGRDTVPTVGPGIQKLDDFCAGVPGEALKLLFWEDEEKRGIREVTGSSTPSDIAVLIGPEGGWASAEVETAVRHGFHTLSLGPRILRAETAPIAVIAILQHDFGDL
ncbi:MAG: 16S rRNA (uracil(1498)-N(3))-methyltransferase [Nitrospinae bacterium CG11_big_fil_rev_8_21_14_0_20_56_8]|nr:MAG: 16S rRNA (uracil(1498)-N(3))-methyltransferase [Nitrospinae bacterium CG11_big_fil_rev_8_21_14_0_20_56_8]